MRLEDRRTRVDAGGGVEPRPGQIRPPVERRGRVVVGDDPLLVVEVLDVREVAAESARDDGRRLPDHAAVRRDGHDQVAAAELARRVLERVVERRVDRGAVLAVECRHRIAAGDLRALPRDVPREPGRAVVEGRVHLVAARAVVVRARDHVLRVRRVDLDVRLVVRKRVVAVELRVRTAARRDALELRVRAVLLVEPLHAGLDRPLLRHSCLRQDRPRSSVSGPADGQHRCDEKQ